MNDEPKRRCPKCGRLVTLGIVTKTVLRHDDKAGAVCAGTGLAKSKTLTQTLGQSTPKRAGKGKQGRKTGARSRRTEGVAASKVMTKRERKAAERALQAIRLSESEERSVRRAAYQDEYGSETSVRTRGGGLPGLGKKN
jgi:hypothetical protein